MERIRIQNRCLATCLMLVALLSYTVQLKANEVIGDTWYIYGTGVEGKNADEVQNISNPPSADFTKIKLVGTFSSGWGGGALTNDWTVGDKGSVTVIDLSEAVLPTYTITNWGGGTGGWSFKNFTNVSSIIWPTSTTSPLKTIPPSAFYGCGIEELVIPATVEEIYSEAFGEMHNLQYVTIQPSNDHPFRIRQHAFDNSDNIREVRVTTPIYTLNGVTYPRCDYEAFSFDATDGQTQIQNLIDGNCATLILPDVGGLTEAEKEANYEWFVGSYKENLVVRQDNIIDSRDNYAGNNRYESNIRTTHGGWWQFFMSTSPNVIPVDDSGFIRTFSDSQVYELPASWLQISKQVYNSNPLLQERYPKLNELSMYDFLVARTLGYGNYGDYYEGTYYYCWGYPLEAYRVINYQEDEPVDVNGNPKNPKATVKLIPDYIPSNTGVILRSSVTGEDRIYYLKKADRRYDTTNFIYKESTADAATANLLYPSVSSVLVHPVDRGGIGQFVESAGITHRNFGFTTNSKYGASISTPKFVRLKQGNTKDNRAYLKLTKDQFPHNNETADGGPGTSFAKSFSMLGDDVTTRSASSSTSNSDLQILGIVGFEDFSDFSIVFPDDIDFDVATSIEQVTNSRNDNVIYSIQGVRVESPSKGVYIKNGRKIIIK